MHLATSISNLIYTLGPSLWFLYYLFPVSYAMGQAVEDFGFDAYAVRIGRLARDLCGGTPDDVLVEGIANLRTACAEVGRDPAEVGVRAGLPVALDAGGGVDLDATRARADALGAIGVTTVSVALGRFIRSQADIEPFLAELVSALRA